MDPSVTVAIPTRNRADLLPQALRSALDQSHPDLEILVSDNASTDATPAFLAGVHDARVRVLRHGQDQGMVANWNACLDAARGEFFLLLSDDDRLDPRAIERLVQAHGSRPDIAFAYGRCRIDHGAHQELPGQVAPLLEPGADLVLAFWAGRRILYPCGMLLRRQRLVEVGGYPASFPCAADSAAWIPLAFGGTVAHVPEPVATYRIHPGSLGSTLAEDRILADLQGLLDLSRESARRAGLPRGYQASLEASGRARIDHEQIRLLFRWAQAGASRRELLGRVWSTRSVVLARWSFSLPRILLLLLLPRRVFEGVRRLFVERSRPASGMERDP